MTSVFKSQDNPASDSCFDSMANLLVQRLKGLLPELKYSRETHVQWRDCHQKYRDRNPEIGDSNFHAQAVRDYDERIAVIMDTIAYLEDLN